MTEQLKRCALQNICQKRNCVHKLAHYETHVGVGCSTHQCQVRGSFTHKKKQIKLRSNCIPITEPLIRSSRAAVTKFGIVKSIMDVENSGITAYYSDDMEYDFNIEDRPVIRLRPPVNIRFEQPENLQDLIQEQIFQ